MTTQTLVLPHGPTSEMLVEAKEHRCQSRTIEFPVVADPTPSDGVDTQRNVLDLPTRPVAQTPPADLLPHRRGRFRHVISGSLALVFSALT